MVDMAKVASVTSDAPLTTQFKDSTTVTGVTVIDQQNIHVTSDTVASTSSLGQLQATWLPSAEPPPESLFDPRHWVYGVGADIAGKSGNSDEMTTNVLVDMGLVSKADELRFYGSYERAEQDGDETSDESIAGASYTALHVRPLGLVCAR